MSDNQSNPFANGSVIPTKSTVHQPVKGSRLAVSLPMIFAGLVVGVTGLALVSNQFGNTDTYGLPLVGLGGMFLCTGIGSLILKLRHSIILGIVAAPASVFLLFLLYWSSIIIAAIMNS